MCIFDIFQRSPTLTAFNYLFYIPLLLLLTVTHSFGPPKIEYQSNTEVWFQVNPEEKDLSKFTLRCQASGNPETFLWQKNGEKLNVDGERVVWQKPSQSGTIIFTQADPADQGYYQCFASNLFGTAVSNKMHAKLGVLDYFIPRPHRKLIVEEGKSLTIPCSIPTGVPPPTVFWLFRDALHNSVIETIRRKRIVVDGEGRLHFTSVELQDGRPNLIYQCAVTSPVLHGEYRAGDEYQLIVEPSPRSSIMGVHKLYFSPEEVNVRAGSKLRLYCIFGGRPPPIVTWSKLDGELPKRRMKDLTLSETDYGKTLIIENLNPDDEGTYECRSEYLFHQMRVKVTASPFWELEPPRDIEQPEESTAQIHCLASGTPTPIIQWSMNGRPLHELNDNNRRLVLDNGRILRIVRLDHDIDTGVYQCNASNPFGYIYANAYINVLAYAPRFKMSEKRIWNAVRKSTVEMSCDVEAAPEAVVRWVNIDDQSIAVIPGKIQLFKNYTLRILHVNSADEGVYYCNVSNKYGIGRAYNKLQVFDPTHFVRAPEPKNLVIEAHEEVELFCEAVSDPRLEIEYQWLHNGAVTNSSLHLKNVRGWHAGEIICLVTTDVDVKMSGMQLTVLDKPAKCFILDVNCNERRASIKWQKPNDHGDAIQSFIAQMHTNFDEGKWKTVFQETNTREDFYHADITLSPWVNYKFRIIAKNSHGEGEPGYKEDAVCVTNESFPYSNPMNVRAEGTEPDNLVISWNPMVKYDWNAPDLQYIIRYRLNGQGAKWEEIRIEDPLANYTIIRDQPTFREYTVQVRAVNRIGISIVEPTNVIGHSGEDVPLESSREFKLMEFYNLSAAVLKWVHVDKSTVRGHFKGYLIEYWKNGDQASQRKLTVDSEKNSVVLQNLSPISNYTAQIYTINARYKSEIPTSLKFRTPEGIPSKVHNMRVKAVGAYSIFITWERPIQPNGNIRGYFVSFENAHAATIEETYVLHRQTHYLQEDAEPDSGYKISVWAETFGGEGPKVVRTIRTWPIRDLDTPAMKVEVVSLNMIVVDWIPSDLNDWRMSGPTFYVNYTASDDKEWLESEHISLPSTKIVLNDLKEDTTYKLKGVVKEKDRKSVSEEYMIRTPRTATITHLSQESMYSAAWFIAILCALLLAIITALIMCFCQHNRGDKYSVRRKELERGFQIDVEEQQNFTENGYDFK